MDQYLNSKRDIAKNLKKELDELVYQKNSHIELEKFLLLFHKASTSKRKFKTSSLGMVKLLDFKTLESLYWITAKKIEHDNNRARESHATYPERQVLKHIKRFSRAKHYSSFWIKNYCLDVFIPRNLLALEIDGGIHFNEVKSRKDSYKEEYLGRRLGISVAHCDNADTGYFLINVFPFIENRKNIGPKRIKRTMRDIFIITIAHHLTLKDLCNYFGPRLQDVFNEFSTHLKQKELNKSSKVSYKYRKCSLTNEYNRRKNSMASKEELWKL